MSSGRLQAMTETTTVWRGLVADARHKFAAALGGTALATATAGERRWLGLWLKVILPLGAAGCQRTLRPFLHR